MNRVKTISRYNIVKYCSFLFTKFFFTQIFLIASCIILVFNCFLHFSSPSKSLNLYDMSGLSRQSSDVSSDVDKFGVINSSTQVINDLLRDFHFFTLQLEGPPQFLYESQCVTNSLS